VVVERDDRDDVIRCGVGVGVGVNAQQTKNKTAPKEMILGTRV